MTGNEARRLEKVLLDIAWLRTKAIEGREKGTRPYESVAVRTVLREVVGTLRELTDKVDQEV